MQMEALAALSREMEHQEDKDDDGEVHAPLKARQKSAPSLFCDRHVVKVCDDDVGFSSSMLAAQAGMLQARAA